MSDPMIQLVILGVIALFVILRLRSVLGTRTGFEPTNAPQQTFKKEKPKDEEVKEVIDRDIADYILIDSPGGKALSQMKKAENTFSVTEFIEGARQAYEMILIAFEEGDRDGLRPFLADDIYESFEAVIIERENAKLNVDATFIGLREIKLSNAEYDWRSKEGEITLTLIAELTTVVKNNNGKVIEGDKNTIKRQKDIWTFSRVMGSDNPNWILVATSE
ncbi:Tim44/TimA family putative adaptor protein [Amylibacter sp.]|nr:Tim44/TimA family putative adaptor protein [Amylibacter sp.]MDA9004615.1 Tim44/TimA family putative adaptor protein [Amylibacter sp.]MDA9073881.1 Tim44/TimA family putative adaptor protein [Amylibacter sp.]MDB0015003.1 Tim44/TimA family putative adaptor protein [Amylibacter sp.]MDB4079274.1 Tim44/TimA family putative adaptor protein [Amylibacter sp.]|tara:strand:- start:15201 stop:15857 length:657 start_codon:yes stop_codon:yes gene_type:complete